MYGMGCLKMANERRLIDRNEIFPNGTFFASAENPLKSLDDLITRIWSIPTVDAIVTPVKIGQILYCNLPHSEIPLECRVYCICQEEREGIVLDYFRCGVKGWFAKAFGFGDVGKTVFFTKEEALAKMDGERKDGE